MTKVENFGIFFLVIFLFFLSPLFASSAKGEAGLVAYWDFNEGFGQVAKDKSGNGNDGKIYGAKWVEVKSGFALSFDGVDDNVNCGNNPDLSFNERAFSIELLINPNNLKEGRYVLAKGGAREYIIGVGGGYLDRAIMFFGGWGNYRYSKNGAMRKGYWTHIVYVKEGVNLDCYIDGKLSNGSVTAIPSSVSGSSSLQIGGVAGYGYFNGIIDEAKIYNRALTAEEIMVSYEQISLSTQGKYVIESLIKAAKFCLIALMIIFIVIMRKFWVQKDKK